MNFLEHIYNDILPLSPKDDIKEAINYFKNHTCTHIPVVEEGVLLGLLSEVDLQVFEEGKLVVSYAHVYQHFFVSKESNWLEVLHSFAKNETNIMPVLGIKNDYVGYYELTNVMSVFSETPFFNEPGGVLIVEKGIRDYSFSEIAQITESSGGKLIGALVSEMRDDMIQVTIKLSSTGLNEVMQTFRRYGYVIVSGTNSDLFLEDLKDRANYLNKFLNL